MGVAYPRVWNWSHEAHPRPLADWSKAPDSNGFYEIGYMDAGFQPMYGGRAAGITLRERLKQHFFHSHNPYVRRNSSKLYYRCKSFKNFDLAAYVEAVHLAAMDYKWNKRNEWSMHWALEPEFWDRG